MKNILIVLPSAILGGAEQYLKIIAKYHLVANSNVHIFFLKKEQAKSWRDLNHPNLTLHFTDSDSELLGLIPLIKNLTKVRNTVFDYIFTSHVHVTSFVAILIRIGFLRKTNFIARESTSVFTRYSGKQLAFHKFLYKVGYSKVIDLVICQTDFMKRQLIANLPRLINKTQVVTIPNPIDLDSLTKLIKEEALTEYNLGRENYIVAAGRLIPEKGFDILIRAFLSINEQYPNFKLVIFGEGRDRQKLTKLIDDLNLDGKVMLPGFNEKVLHFFKYAKVCIVSSRIEGFPNVLLQMMSQNTKVVSTKCAGGVEQIPGLFIAEVNSERSLKCAIEAAIKADTNSNRIRFDTYLKEKDVSHFIDTVNKHLEY